MSKNFKIGTQHSRSTRGEKIASLGLIILILSIIILVWEIILPGDYIFNVIFSLFLGLFMLPGILGLKQKGQIIEIKDSDLKISNMNTQKHTSIVITDIQLIDFESKLEGKTMSRKIIIKLRENKIIQLDTLPFDKEDLFNLLLELKSESREITITNNVTTFFQADKAAIYSNFTDLSIQKINTSNNFIGAMTGIISALFLLLPIVASESFFSIYSRIRMIMLGLSITNTSTIYVLNYNYTQWTAFYTIFVLVGLWIAVKLECLAYSVILDFTKINKVVIRTSIPCLLIIIPCFCSYYAVTAYSITYSNIAILSKQEFNRSNIIDITREVYDTKSAPKNPSLFILNYTIELTNNEKLDLFKSNQHASVSGSDYYGLDDILPRIEKIDAGIREVVPKYNNTYNKTAKGYDTLNKNYSLESVKYLMQILR